MFKEFLGNMAKKLAFYGQLGDPKLLGYYGILDN